MPPRQGEDDPHEPPRGNNRGSDQKRHFLLTGELLDVCGAACITNEGSERD